MASAISRQRSDGVAGRSSPRPWPYVGVSLTLLLFLLLLAFLVAPATGGRPARTAAAGRSAPLVPSQPSRDAPVAQRVGASLGPSRSPSSDSGRRLLAVSQSAPLIIPLSPANQSVGYSYADALSYVFTGLSAVSSRFILYPYAFNVTSPSAALYPQGAFVSIPSTSTLSTDFSSLQATSTLSLNNAQAVYDSSVAFFISYGVLTGDATNTVRLLTNEAPVYCGALLDSVVDKWQQCWQADAYMQQLKAGKVTEATSLVYVDEGSIASGLLFLPNSTQLRFGSLVFADIYFDSDAAILANVSAAARAQVQLFLQLGGSILTTGKGALIAQGLDLIPSSQAGAPAVTGVFNNQRELVPTSGFTGLPTAGCEQEGNGVLASDLDYIHRALCFSLGSGVAGGATTALVSSSPVDLSALSSSGLSVLSSFRTASGTTFLTRDTNGVGSPIIAGASLPQLLYATSGKGQLIINLANPAQDKASFPWLYNSLLVSNLRPVILEAAFPGGSPPVIPALEQIAVSVGITLINLNLDALVNVEYWVWVAQGINVLSSPSWCTLTAPPAILSPPSTGLNATVALQCSPSSATLSPLSELAGNFTVFIEDVLVTQRQYGIVLLYPQLTYTIPARDGVQQAVAVPVTVTAYVAAQLVGDYNGDPMGVYPLAGSGEFVDNVLTLENKQNTAAINVAHTAVIPLVTPLVDISQQAALATMLDFDYLYYQQRWNGVEDYVYPQPAPTGPTYSATDPAPSDYLDYLVLNARSDQLAANWDEAVWPTKQTRNATFPSTLNGASASIANITLGQYSISNSNAYVVVKQTGFDDAQNYFTYPSPRMMAFLDLTQPAAFAAYNVSSSFPPGQSSFPTWMLNPSGTAFRVQVGLALNNVYFYPPLAGETTYPQPVGYPEGDTVFSLDRYALNGSAACNDGLFDESLAQRTVPGFYGSQFTGEYPPGMRAHEYSNGLLMWCNKSANRADLSDIARRSNGTGALTHYLMPLSFNPAIQSGDDVMYFMRDPAAAGEWYWAASTLTGLARFGDYPEVRIKTVMQATFQLPSDISFRGGLLYMQLAAYTWSWPSTVDPIASEYITWSADEIAVTGMTWDAASRTIVTRFYRGEMPDEDSGAPSQLQVNLENLVWTGEGFPGSSFDAQLSLEQLLYDLTSPPTFETFVAVPSFAQALTFHSQLSLRLPAVRLSFVLNRQYYPWTPLSPSPLLQPFGRAQGSGVSFLLGDEDDQPYTRYGIYTQELLSHRTVYGSAQIDPVVDTGAVTSNSGFSYITHIGESSIPFRQYLSTGAGQLIPATPITGAVRWQDIWGRTMVQPLRSLFTDAAPLPGPLRNFQMTTTFELLAPNANERSLVWRSDDALTVRVQVKVLNNYEKWWVLTTSKHNELLFTAGLTFPGTDFVVNASAYSNLVTAQLAASSSTYLQYGYTATYGSSFSGGQVYLNGTLMSALQMQEIANAIYCVDNYTASCSYIGTLPIPSIRPSTHPDGQWNYASYVDSYWPQGYVQPDMWDLTHPNYDDNVYDYGYTHTAHPHPLHMPSPSPHTSPLHSPSAPFSCPSLSLFLSSLYSRYDYQLDNRLPNIDTGLLKPQNILAYPIFAGLDYIMSYSAQIEHPNFPGYRGWWSDQLQNKDDTLVAGQATSNQISVGAADLTLSVGWLPITELTSVDAASSAALQDGVDAALGNLYTCLFNRQRIITRANSSVASNPANVVQNNVVPVDPTLTANDPRLTSFDCDPATPQYTPATISQFDNFLDTQTVDDWLYFGFNLRGGAVENVNVLYSLQPLNQFEGIATVQEGGEFVYWNPGLGPNCFETVDDPVSNVQSIRSDLQLWEGLYPPVASTFDSTVFQLIQLTDSAEVNRYVTDANTDLWYGFGDSAVRTFSGVEGTSNIVAPGQSFIAQIDLFNNAGFDWDLLQGAIWSEAVGELAWSATDLQSGIAPVVQAPTAYNFMAVQPPAELAPYLTIAPSQLNADVAPLQFDFTSNNVATIRDGFQGSFFYQVSVSPDLPLELMGRQYHVPVHLNQSWFARLPGYNDPTGLHDYALSIPDIVLSFPYPSSANKAWANKAFYVNGRSHNLQWAHQLSTAWTAVGAKVIDQNDLLALSALTSASTEVTPSALAAYWQALNNSWNVPVPFTAAAPVNGYSSLNLNLAYATPTGQFPIPQSPLLGPDPASLYVLLQTHAAELNPTFPNQVTYGTSLRYQDFTNATKQAGWGGLSMYAEGPFLTVTYSLTLVDATLTPLADPSLHCSDSGLALVTVLVHNIGTASAYAVHMSTAILNAELAAAVQQPVNYALSVSLQASNPNNTAATSSPQVLISVDAGAQVLDAGGFLSAAAYVRYFPAVSGASVSCPASRTFSQGANASFAVYANGETRVQQSFNAAFSLALSDSPRLAAAITAAPLNASMAELAGVDVNSSAWLVTASPPNLSVEQVLQYTSTSAYPALTANDWTFAYQWTANVTSLNRWGNGTVSATHTLNTTRVTNGQNSSLVAALPLSWVTVAFQAQLGVASLLTADNLINRDPASMFIPRQTSNVVLFAAPLAAPAARNNAVAGFPAWGIALAVALPLLLLLALGLVTLALRRKRRLDGVQKSVYAGDAMELAVAIKGKYPPPPPAADARRPSLPADTLLDSGTRSSLSCLPQPSRSPSLLPMSSPPLPALPHAPLSYEALTFHEIGPSAFDATPPSYQGTLAYEPRFASELKLEVGDELINVVDAGDVWCQATKRRTGSTGKVPRAHIARLLETTSPGGNSHLVEPTRSAATSSADAAETESAWPVLKPVPRSVPAPPAATLVFPSLRPGPLSRRCTTALRPTSRASPLSCSWQWAISWWM